MLSFLSSARPMNLLRPFEENPMGKQTDVLSLSSVRSRWRDSRDCLKSLVSNLLWVFSESRTFRPRPVHWHPVLYSRINAGIVNTNKRHIFSHTSPTCIESVITRSSYKTMVLCFPKPDEKTKWYSSIFEWISSSQITFVMRACMRAQWRLNELRALHGPQTKGRE